MPPGMLKGERVASLTEAQDQAQNSYPKIREKTRERPAKDPRKICEGSRKPSKPPALQAVGDDIASAIRFWSYKSVGKF